MGVGGNARPIGLIGRPVDEAGVMLWDEDRPFGAQQLADLPFAPPGRIERDLTPGFSVNIGARVNHVEWVFSQSGNDLPKLMNSTADSGGSRPGFRDDLAHHSDLMSLGCSEMISLGIPG